MNLRKPRGVVRQALTTVSVVAALLVSACHTGRNYTDANAPRSAAGPFDPVPGVMPASLRLVTFNIAFAQRIDEAITVLTTDPVLRDADIVLLQEMNGAAAARIAAALHMGYVYYPAIFHLRSDRDFGNAILTRWPMVADERIALPHQSHTTGTQRSATAATLRIGHRRVRVYSVHLGTFVDIRPGERRDQIERVIADAN